MANMTVSVRYQHAASHGQALQAGPNGKVEPWTAEDARAIVGYCAEPNGALAGQRGLTDIQYDPIPWPTDPDTRAQLAEALRAELLHLATVLPPDTEQPDQDDIDQWPDTLPDEWHGQ